MEEGGAPRVTIKRRLLISNILMIVIPAVVSVIVTGLCFVIFYVLFNDMLLEWIKAEKDMKDALTIAAYEGILAVMAIVAFVVLIILTDRFLSKFVFKKIEQPLAMLSDGVHQISEGNLSYRIVYAENDEFRQVCDDFNGMAEHLQASIEEVQKNERNRKELLTGISHDLRSPLTSIKAFVEGLQDGVAATPEAQREYLAVIHQKTDDIVGMVSQLFLYSKMDMGNYPTSPERLDIGKELVDFVAASQEEYRAKGLRIEMAAVPADRYVYADPVQLRSVFTNILSNSAKYKNKAAATAVVRCELQGAAIRLLFEDDGPGVPGEALPKLFDAFYRSDPSRSGPYMGSGLGLAIARKAVERMGGRTYAENLAQGGLRVAVEIPELEREPS